MLGVFRLCPSLSPSQGLDEHRFIQAFMDSNIEIISARVDCRTSHQLDLQEWLGSSATPPHVITVEATVPPELSDLTAALAVEAMIKFQLPQLCSKYPELIEQEWRVHNLAFLGGTASLFQTVDGTYRVQDTMMPIHRDGNIATFTLIPKAYEELAYFQRSLWKLGLRFLSLQGVPIYRMWLEADGTVLYLHLKSRDPLPAASNNDIYNWVHLGTPIDLAEVGTITQRQYPTHRGSSGTINNLEIAIPLNGTQLLVGNVITAEDDSPTPTEPPIPSCLNCQHFGGAIPATREDPGEEASCQHPDRESFPSVDPDAENEALSQGDDATWQLYAQDCPGYEYQDPKQAQEPDDLPLLTLEDRAIALQLEADLLQYGPGQVFAYPLLPQRADWIPPEQLLPEAKLQRVQRSACKFLTPVEAAFLTQHSVRQVNLMRQAPGSDSPIPKLTTIVVSTPTGDRIFQFNGAHIDEFVPALGGKVKRIEVRSPKGEWYDHPHLEVMQCLYALENAIRRMVGMPEASWDAEPDLEDFEVLLVGIDPDAPAQEVFE